MSDRHSQIEEKKRKLALLKEERELRAQGRMSSSANLLSQASLNASASEMRTPAGRPPRESGLSVASSYMDATPMRLDMSDQKGAATPADDIDTPEADRSSTPVLSNLSVVMDVLNFSYEPSSLVYNREVQTDGVDFVDKSALDELAAERAEKCRLEEWKRKHEEEEAERQRVAAQRAAAKKESKVEDMTKLAEAARDNSKYKEFVTRAAERMKHGVAVGGDVHMEASAGLLQRQRTANDNRKLQKVARLQAPNINPSSIVTSVCFQPENRTQWMVASYAPPGPPTVLDCAYSRDLGTVCMWSLVNPKEPYRVFSCPSQVSTLSYCGTNEALMIAGTYAGSVIVWDSRDHCDKPAAVSRVSPDAHYRPIFSLKHYSQSNFLTVSSDSRLCMWDMSKLSAPVEGCQMMHAQTGERRSNIIPISNCLAGGEKEGTFYVGGEDGYLYHGSRHAISDNTLYLDRFKGHYASISGIDYNKRMGILLTAGTDWQCKVWSAASRASSSIQPFSNFVFDAKWDPTSASRFAAGDASGAVTLWELRESLSSPAAQEEVATDENRYATVNKVAWSPDGGYLAAGDSMRTVTVFRVKPEEQADDGEFRYFVDQLKSTSTNTTV